MIFKRLWLAVWHGIKRLALAARSKYRYWKEMRRRRKPTLKSAVTLTEDGIIYNPVYSDVASKNPDCDNCMLISNGECTAFRRDKKTGKFFNEEQMRFTQRFYIRGVERCPIPSRRIPIW